MEPQEGDIRLLITTLYKLDAVKEIYDRGKWVPFVPPKVVLTWDVQKDRWTSRIDYKHSVFRRA